ncbi:MAG: hypothetical protein COA36_11760 [Desulfotalea sp.]|nr:MAG: hypothetical protein COA36_11760 [Desulfotalea sp.]
MITLETISLSDELYWEDEHAWSPVEQPKPIRNVTGSLEVNPSLKIGGRPITLSGSEERAWLPYKTILALKAMAAIPGKVMNLTLDDGRTFKVMFRYHDGNPVSAFSVFGDIDPGLDDKYWIILRLMEVIV